MTSPCYRIFRSIRFQHTVMSRDCQSFGGGQEWAGSRKFRQHTTNPRESLIFPFYLFILNWRRCEDFSHHRNGWHVLVAYLISCSFLSQQQHLLISWIASMKLTRASGLNALRGTTGDAMDWHLHSFRRLTQHFHSLKSYDHGTHEIPFPTVWLAWAGMERPLNFSTCTLSCICDLLKKMEISLSKHTIRFQSTWSTKNVSCHNLRRCAKHIAVILRHALILKTIHNAKTALGSLVESAHS